MKESESTTTTSTTKMGSLFKTMGVAAAAAFVAAAAAVTSFAKSAVTAYGVQEDAEKRLESVITATGGAAGLTTDEMKKYATQLQSVTRYGDEVTISAMAILATFKSIKGNNFKDTISTAQDLATVMGTDLNSAVLQLGKALEDPAKGITALRRSGVSFSTEQIAQIKDLVSEGDKYNAQLLILKEVQSQFGGAAKDAAETSAGAIEQLSNVWGDVTENIGKAIVEGTNMVAVMKQLADTVPYMESLFDFKAASQLFIYAKGVDNLIGSYSSVDDQVAALKNNIAELYDVYKSFDKGNPFMLQQPQITTNAGTEYEQTTTGDDAVAIYELSARKIELLNKELNALLVKQAKERGVAELNLEDKTIEELKAMRSSYVGELDEIQKAQLGAINGEITSRVNVEVSAESSNSIAGLQAKIKALKELANVDPNTEKIREYGEEIATLSKELSRLVEARNTGILRVDITPILGDIDTKGITKELDNVLSEMLQDTEIDPITIPPVETKNFAKSIEDLAITVGDIKSIASSFGSELGDALADGGIDSDELKAMFVTPLAEAAASFAPLLIAQGQAMNALKSGNGWAMIAGGIALAAISSAVVAAANATNSSLDGSGTSSTIDTFTGGYSSGTSDDIWTSTRSIDITVTGKLEGQDIALSSERYYKYNNR